MKDLKKSVAALEENAVVVMQCFSNLSSLKSESKDRIERCIDDFQCELETFCVKARTELDCYRKEHSYFGYSPSNILNDIAGSIEVTDEGWLHITLNTLLPNCRRRISNYIGDTISRLIESSEYELPYFETAFMAIVEYCNHKNHNALDNDNKGWKMIPNALKGRVIEDDNQFILSIGLFSKISDDIRCEIYVMAPEDGSCFMDLLANDML